MILSTRIRSVAFDSDEGRRYDEGGLMLPLILGLLTKDDDIRKDCYDGDH